MIPPKHQGYGRNVLFVHFASHLLGLPTNFLSKDSLTYLGHVILCVHITEWPICSHVWLQTERATSTYSVSGIDYLIESNVCSRLRGVIISSPGQLVRYDAEYGVRFGSQLSSIPFGSVRMARSLSSCLLFG